MGINTHLIIVDISKPFDWRSNLSMTAVPKPGSTAPPVTTAGSVLYGSDDDPNIYLFGGTVSNVNTSFPGYRPALPITYTMWSFNIKSHDWQNYDLTRNIQYRPNSGMNAGAREQHLSFYLNGQVDWGSSSQTVNLDSSTSIYQPGMIIINHDTQTAINVSTDALVGKKPRSRGGLQYMVGIGPKGLLVLIGGNEKDVSDTTDRGLGELVPMDTVHIFDVSSIYDDRLSTGGTWYEQPVTGDIPERRVDFCIIKATVGDSSSANLYMYGGRGANDVIFDDIYVLSLPSFTWTKVYQGDSGRYGHTCHRGSQREMIAVGGATSTNLSAGRCDWRTKGIDVLDISEMTWSSKYNLSTAEYFVPHPVVARIGGNEQGNATMIAPARGFADRGLARMFDSDFVSSASAASQSDSTAPATTQHPSATKRAIIAGGVVGGSVLLGLSITAGWYCRRMLQQIWFGDLAARLEMDGKGKSMSELPGKGTSWELPGNEPAELWCPTAMGSPTSSTDVDDFKHETSSDRELGWRGEIECEGNVARRQYVLDTRNRDDARSNHTRWSFKELE
ncbi:hypothetical protein XANCAGTX0491_001803 [Xanthoria calcicola]